MGNAQSNFIPYLQNASIAYGLNNQNSNVSISGWKPVKVDAFKNTSQDFAAQLLTDGQGHYRVAIRGSEPLPNVAGDFRIADWNLANGRWDAQLTDAIRFVGEAILQIGRANPGMSLDDIRAVMDGSGHSLGGAAYELAASFWGLRGMNIDGPGVGPQTGMDQFKALKEEFRARGLGDLQDHCELSAEDFQARRYTMVGVAEEHIGGISVYTAPQIDAYLRAIPNSSGNLLNDASRISYLDFSTVPPTIHFASGLTSAMIGPIAATTGGHGMSSIANFEGLGSPGSDLVSYISQRQELIKAIPGITNEQLNQIQAAYLANQKASQQLYTPNPHLILPGDPMFSGGANDAYTVIYNGRAIIVTKEGAYYADGLGPLTDGGGGVPSLFFQPQHPSSQPTTVYNSATALANTSNSAYYQIQAGDTVGSIAAKLGISRQEYETYLKSVYGPHADLNSLTAGGKLPVPDAVAQAQMGSGLIQHQGQAPSNMVAGVTVQQGQQGSINGTTVEYDKERGWVDPGNGEVVMSLTQWQDNLSQGQAEYIHGGDQKLHGGTPDVILGWQAYLMGESASTSDRKTIAMRTNADVQDSAIAQGKAGTTLAGSAAGQGLGATFTLGSSALVGKPIAFNPNGESQSRDVTAGVIRSLVDGLFGGNATFGRPLWRWDGKSVTIYRN